MSGSKESKNILWEQTALPDPNTYIKSVVIPKMDIRSGRTQPMTRADVHNKLFNITMPKPGEAYELVVEGTQLTPKSASEIADIVYYTYQPNCPDHLRNLSPLLDLYKITLHQAEMFCIIKYAMRLEHGDKSIHKKIENLALQYYLQTNRLTH